MTELTDNEKAKQLREKFENAMSGKAKPNEEVVIIMKDFLKKRIDKINAKAQEHFERAKALHIRQGQPLEDDPYAAPLLSLAKAEAAKANRYIKHVNFIERKEQEIKAAEDAAKRNSVQAPGVNNFPKPIINWGMNGISLIPTKTGVDEPK